MDRILFIYNPVSGKGAIKSKLYFIIETLSQMGIVTVMPTTKNGDAVSFIVKYMKDYDLVVCSGGDGTLNEVTTGYMSVDKSIRKPCGYIPAGTVNDFATSLGIPKNITKCVNQFSNSTVFPYDIGEFCDKYFNYIAGFGAFTKVAYSTSQSFKNFFGKTAYILEAVKHLAKIKGIKATVQAKKGTFSDEYIYGMICNTFSVGGVLKIDNGSIALDDGKFEAIFVKKPKNPIELQETLNDILAKKYESKHFLYLRDNKFHITFDEPIEWTIDGEFGGEYKEVDIINHERAIDFLKPKSEKGIKNV